MQQIPIVATPSQKLTVLLGGQQCQINIYQKSTGVFLDLYLNNSPIVTAIVCLNLVKLVRYTYLGFIGDLTFVDTQGTDDPDYTGFGSRFVLAYLEAADL